MKLETAVDPSGVGAFGMNSVGKKNHEKIVFFVIPDICSGETRMALRTFKVRPRKGAQSRPGGKSKIPDARRLGRALYKIRRGIELFPEVIEKFFALSQGGENAGMPCVSTKGPGIVVVNRSLKEAAPRA